MHDRSRMTVDPRILTMPGRRGGGGRRSAAQGTEKEAAPRSRSISRASGRVGSQADQTVAHCSPAGSQPPAYSVPTKHTVKLPSGRW